MKTHEKALDRARDKFLSYRHGHHTKRDGEDLNDHQPDDHEPEVATRGVDALGGEQVADVVEKGDREQRAEELRNELAAVADEQDRVTADDSPHGVVPQSGLGHRAGSKRPSLRV